MSENKKNIHILGGGPAGLATAFYAHLNGLEYTLYEKNSDVGGNCRTIKYKDFLFDTGAHRLHEKIPYVTNDIKSFMRNELLHVDAPSKIFNNGTMINFPLSITDILKNIDVETNFKIIKENIKNRLFSCPTENNFKSNAYKTYGKTLADLFLINYSEKLWGINTENLSPDTSGGRLKNLNLKSIVTSLFFSNATTSRHLDGSFLYPKYGFGQIFNNLSHQLNEDRILCNSDVDRVIISDDEINKIILADGKEVQVSRVVNTLPISILIRKMNIKPNNDVSEVLNKIKYRSVKLLILLINKNHFSLNASIYFPSSDVPFTRIYEPKNRSPFMCPEDKTSIVIEFPYFSNELKFEDSDYLLKVATDYLTSNKLLLKNDIIDSHTVDMPYAYPVLDIKTAENIKIVKQYLKTIKNLHNIGRSAEFEYLHVHDLFDRAKKLTKYIKNH